MANVVFIENSEKAIDPDHVAVLNLTNQSVILASGKTLNLSPDDFDAVLKAKEGK